MGQDVVPRVFLAVRVWAAHPSICVWDVPCIRVELWAGSYTHMRQNIPNTDNYV